MSGLISVGDLVQVVGRRSCCESDKDLGGIYTASGFYRGYQCSVCGATVDTPVVLLNGAWIAKEVSRLKRIPPLDELEGKKRDEEITA